MVQIYREEEHASLWHSIISTIAGKYLSRRQRAIRAFAMLILFGLMALPILIDWLH